MRTFDKVIPILKKNWLRIATGLILIVLVDVLQLIVPKIMQRAVDSLDIPGFTQSGLLRYSLLILLIAVGIAAIRFLWRLLLIGNAWIVDRDVRQLYYEHLMKLSKNFFDKAKIGDLMAYATNDLNAVRMLIGFGLVIIIDIIVFSVTSMIFMININLRLTLLAIIPMPILTVVIIVFGRKIHKHFRAVQKSFAALSGQVQESISGIRVVKAFVQEKSELEKVSRSAYTYVKENISLVRIFGLFHPTLFLVISISMGIVLVFGGSFAMFGMISMGEFVAFFSYLGMFVWPMIAIGWFVNLYQRGKASLVRLNSIFEVSPEVCDHDPDLKIRSLEGRIEIRGLRFRYRADTPVILDDVSFELERGKTLAIVGRTGCGKTTLIDLMTRVYDPPEGSIFIDGNEIYRIPLKILRDHLVTVPQDIFLFSDSIADNIRLGKKDASLSEVKCAARYAQVHDEILGFEKGFDTVIGERGVTLSGGQKQRLAIARAIILDPSVLILDDALSSVDTKTEKKLLEHLIKLRENKTTIIIAHRISSLQHADKIIVIDNKIIAETGTHKDLLAAEGIYRDLYEKQKIEEKLRKV